MNITPHSRLTSWAGRLSPLLVLSVTAFLPDHSVAGTPLAGATATGDQIHPEYRLRRLGQLFDELQALLADYHVAIRALTELEQRRTAALVVYESASRDLQTVLQDQARRRALQGNVPPRLVGPRLAQALTAAHNEELATLTMREAVARQKISAAQGVLAEWTSANQRVKQLSEAAHLQEKVAEWLWLCDPLGKLGVGVHRAGIDMFSRQIARDANFGLSYLGRGFAYLHAGRFEEARGDFATAAQREASVADVSAAARGWACARLRNDSQAATEFGEALKLNPQSPAVELILGHAYAERQKDTFAEEHFRKAVDLGGHLAQTRDDLAWFLAARRQNDPICLKHAIQQATKACEMTVWRQWLYLDTLAFACAVSGDIQLAVQWGGKAVEYAPREYRTGLQTRLVLYQAKSTVGIPSVAALSDNRPHSHRALPRPEFAAPGNERRYLEGLRKSLQIGFGDGNDGLARARSHNDAIKALCSSDARLSLAWGLVCLKQGQLDDAQRQFEQALEAADERYLPAWQALVRTQILQGRPAAARHSLILLAVAFDRPENRAFSEDWTAEYENWWTQAVAFIDENFDPDARPAVHPGDGQRQDAPDAKRPGGMAARPAGVGRAEQKLTREQREAAAQQAEQAKLDRDKAALETDRKALESAHQEQVGKIDEYLATLNVRYNQLQLAADRLAADASAKGLIPPRQHDHMVDEMLKIERQVKLLRQQRAARFNQTATHAERLNGTEASLAKRERALLRAEGQRRVRGVQAEPPAQRPAPSQADMDLRFPIDYEAEAQRILASYLVHPTMSAPTQRLLDSPPSAKK
jgi:tetratricopeptide (TPR) repeat protein